MPLRFGSPRPPVPRARHGRAVTAAASVLPTKRHAGPAGVPVWQQQAWDFFDQIGEVRYAARYYGNSLSRLRLYVGWRSNPNEPVVPIDVDEPPDGWNRQSYDVAERTLGRLHSGDGSVSELLRAFGVNLFVAGEGYIVGRADEDTNRETWDFLSVDQVVWYGDRWNVRESVADKPSDYQPLDLERDVVRRVWLPHPRFAREADSPMRAVLTVCEELLLLSASVRASALSRIASGILLLPDTMLDGGPDTYIDGDPTDGEAQADRTLSDIVEHFIKPIADPDSAAAVAPFILAGDPDDIDKVRLLEPSRMVDEVAATQRTELLVRLANGVDLPPEVLQGFGNSNHWSAWIVDEQTFRVHIAPAAQLFASAVTEQLVWPSLSAAGLPVDERMVVGFDPSDLVGHPDRKSNAKDGHNALVISDESYRRALGFGDEDAPDALEYLRRMALANGTQGLAPVAAGQITSVVDSIRATAPTGGVGAPAAIPAATPSGDGGSALDGDLGGNAGTSDEPSAVEAGPPEVSGLTASARDRADDFGRLLGRLDRALFDRLEGECSAALDRALEKAGARLRSRLARVEGVRDLVAGAAARDVGRLVGADAVAAAGVATDDLVDDDEFEELAALLLLLSGRAQERVRNRLRRDFDLSDVELQAMEAKQSEDRSNAATYLVAAMVGLAVGALYGGKPSAPPLGEFDPSSRVPSGVVRSALSVAGGGPPTVNVSATGGVSVVAPTPGVVPGLAVEGPTVREFGGAVGLVEVGFLWDYGDEMRQTFEPHFELDGQEFAGPEDSRLTNMEDWPATAFFAPGDHDGCRCTAIPVYAAVAVEVED